MALLRWFLALLLLSLTGLSLAAERPLLDYTFSGYGQGRLTAFLINTEKLHGPLNTLPDPSQAGGESETAVYLNRLEISLGTPLAGHTWHVRAKAVITGSKGVIESAYVSWTPTPLITSQAGLITVPFGLENQLSSRLLPTVERALIYGFGNFGWVSDLGFKFMDQYAYGIRLNAHYPGPWPGWQAHAQLGLVTSNGALARPDWPSQLTGRAGVSRQWQNQNGHGQWALGFSASWGWSAWEQHHEAYLPIGSQKSGQALSSLFIPATLLDQAGPVAVLGPDMLFQIDAVTVRGEWLAKNLDGHWAQGYYILSQWDLFHEPAISLTGKWEESVAFFSDGAHAPGTRYQALTLGLIWKLSSAWRLQGNYLALYKDFKPHQFTGADLFITQLQFEF